MAITAINRDYGNAVEIVRIVSSDTLSVVGTAGYITAQAANIYQVNKGSFEWKVSDFVLVYASNGWGQYTISADYSSLNEYSNADTILLPAMTLFGNPTASSANGQPITLGSGLTFSGTVLSSQGGLTWSVQTTSPKQMITNNGYISDSVSLVNYTLPPVAGTNAGDIVRIVGFEVGGWKLSQNAAQTIHFGLDNSTSGVTGYIASSSNHDCVELVALSGNDWILTSSIGNISFN